MIKKYTYYRGTFNSQFSFPEEIKPNTSYSKGSKGKFFGLLFEEKKELVNAVPILKEEYENAIFCSKDAQTCECEIHNKGESFPFKQSKQINIELDSNRNEAPIRVDIDEFVLVFNRDASNLQTNSGDFLSSKERRGKLSAEGFIRVYELIPENPEEKKEIIKKKLNPKRPKATIDIDEKGGCFKNKSGTGLVGGIRNGLFGNSATGSSGCFGSNGQAFGVPNSGVYGNRGGCFGGQSGGCFSLGWLWQLLKWLMFLGLLLYLLSMLRTCDMTPQERVVYVHDTIQTVRIDTVNVIEETTVTSTDKISLPNVQFKTDSDQLIEGSMPDIQALAEFMVRNDSVTATIEGHTDDVGDEVHNLELSKARAEAVKKELVAMGVDESRISTVGYGEERPKSGTKANPDTSEEGRLLNRRVEVKLTNMGSTTTTETSETTESNR
jgi:outer membrane protein OmpA-like peptidoglycan-associated protein